MSSKCCCIDSCGSTFSMRVSIGCSGMRRRIAHSMSTMCCSSEPSCPVSPGGLSRILEWSLQGGAVVISIVVPGIKCPRIVSTDELREQTKDVEDAVDAAMVPIPSDQSDAVVADASVLDLCSIERGIEEGEKQRYKAALEQMIADKYSRESVELSSGDAGKIAALSLSLGAVDVMEVFSPSRFTSMASKFGLRRGVAVDLTEVKENGVEQWDLDKKEDRLEVEAIIENDQPWLVTGSPLAWPILTVEEVDRPETGSSSS